VNFRQQGPDNPDPFLKMIAANPTDNVARLVFADWLEDRGEPWADFIRAQIALTNLSINSTERTELTALTTGLYWKHHRYWNGHVYRQWMGTPFSGKRSSEIGLRGWQYRRGLPEILVVNAYSFVEHADLFLGAAPFREVVLRRLPTPVGAFLMAHEAILSRLDKVIITIMVHEVAEISRLSTGLRQRIRIGVRDQIRLPNSA